MDSHSSLDILKSVLETNYSERLIVRKSEKNLTPFLVIDLPRPTDLNFIPSFHCLAFPAEQEKCYTIKLFSFHGKLLEETVVDLTTSLNEDDFKLIRQFSSGNNFFLCRGRPYDTTSSDNVLVENLEDEIVVRSFDCEYLVKLDEADDLLSFEKFSPVCATCEKFFNQRDVEVDLLHDNGLFSADENLRTDPEQDTADPQEQPTKNEKPPPSAVLEKLKSLNLPVTVSIGSSPPPKKKKSDKSTGSIDITPAVDLSKLLETKKKPLAKKSAGPAVNSKCRWCESTFDRLPAFKEHIRSCSKGPKATMKPLVQRSTKPFLPKTTGPSADGFTFSERCKVCLHVYTNKARFVHDMRQHRKQLQVDLEAPINCPTCNEVVEKRMLLNDHYAAKHLERDNDGICCECYQTMPAEKLKYHFYYKHHMQQLDRKHLCPICGKSLIYAYQLQVHMAVHHKGEVVPESGDQPATAAAAVKNVESESMCDQCGKVFAHRSLLCVHVRKQHTRSKAFPCKFCSKAFNAPGALMEHLGSVHLKLKPYQCRECQYATSHKNNIYKHFLQHHGRKGNSDDVHIIPEVMEELKRHVKRDDSENS